MKTNPTIFFLIIFFLTAVSYAQTADNSEALRKLSLQQIESLKNIKTKAAREAAPLAKQLAVTVKQVYDNMLADKPDEKRRKKLSKQMTDTTGKLLLIKGNSIRAMIAVLTPEQKELLKSEMKKPDAPADLSELFERVFIIPKDEAK